MRTHIKILTTAFLLFTLFLSVTVSAQFACPNARRCTSKDLTLVDAKIVTSSCSCTGNGTITGILTMRINNTTGSVRTAFAFFGTLVKTNPDGTTQSSPISGCGGELPPNDTTELAFSNISFTCGQSLKLINLFLAWTDASGLTIPRCALILADSCASIAPKCGTLPEIIINTPLAVPITTDSSCNNAPTGSITVTPTGGKPPYDITINGTTTNNVLTATKTGLAGGTYNVSVTDSDDPACTINTTATVPTKNCCTPPPKPAVCQIPAPLCGGDGTASLVITNAVVGDTYKVRQGGTTQSKVAISSTATFAGLTPGVNFRAWGENIVGNTKCTSDTARCADVTGTCAQSIAAQSASQIQTQPIRLPEKSTKVSAAPNPFNDRIRFVMESSRSGQGSLELYNLMGQKVKTVFQGYIQKGQVQVIEYSVPMAQRNNLVYIFRVGNEKTSGMLIGIK